MSRATGSVKLDDEEMEVEVVVVLLSAAAVEEDEALIGWSVTIKEDDEDEDEEEEDAITPGTYSTAGVEELKVLSTEVVAVATGVKTRFIVDNS